MQNIIDTANGFCTDAEIVGEERWGCGHINDTYKVVDKNGKFYVLQRINHNVFGNVDGLMQNIAGVTDYIAKRTPRGEEALRVIDTKDGKKYCKTDAGYFRMHNFIYSGTGIESNPTLEELQTAAAGFGRFYKLLAGYPAEQLFDTIPDFHNTAKRLEALCKAMEEDRAGRLSAVRKETEWYLNRKKYASVAVDALATGELPLRVTHNDTKLNNVLIDKKNLRPVAVIDLDTVMKGSIIYDFGDGIRSGANTGAEDERELDKVHFSLEAFGAYSRGFLGETGKELTAGEKDLLAFGAILMTYECGMRFLTDYLNGDVYFRTNRENQNLDRTRTHMRLAEEMEEKLPEMKEIVNSFID